MKQQYYYHLLPDDRDQPECAEIDLNASRHFHVLFSGLQEQQTAKDNDTQDKKESIRSLQLRRWQMLQKHLDVLNLIAHTLIRAEKASGYSASEYRKKETLEAVMNGTYGSLPKQFFQKTEPELAQAQEIILWYLSAQAQKKMPYCLQSVLKEIYHQDIVFYFDTAKHILYLSLLIRETEADSLILSVCCFLFADMFLHTETIWNCSPFILDKNAYAVAGEHEQQCGTII